MLIIDAGANLITGQGTNAEGNDSAYGNGGSLLRQAPTMGKAILLHCIARKCWHWHLWGRVRLLRTVARAMKLDRLRIALSYKKVNAFGVGAK